MRLPEIGLGTANALRVGLPEFIEVAARHGFRRITARPHAFATCLREGLDEGDLQRLLATAGIEVTMIDALMRDLPGVPAPEHLDPKVRARLTPDALDPPTRETCFRAARVLGARLVNVATFLGVPVALDEMAAAIRTACREAAPHGLRIALEFVPESAIPDLAYARALVETCGEPNCGITLDVFHLDRSGGGVEDLRRLPRDAIAGIQLSDRVRPAAGVAHVPFQGRCLPGEGELPLRDLLAAALENSPEATLDLEVLSPELEALPVDERFARLADGVGRWLASL